MNITEGHNWISMALCKTAVTPLLTHWSYCSLALSHRYGVPSTRVRVNSSDRKVHGAYMGPPESCRPQMGPMLTPWTLLSGSVHNRMIPTVWRNIMLKDIPMTDFGPISTYKLSFPGIGIPIIKIRQLWDHHIFIMIIRIPTLARLQLYNEMSLRYLDHSEWFTAWWTKLHNPPWFPSLAGWKFFLLGHMQLIFVVLCPLPGA